jgi:hypothetical protein
MYAGWLGLLFLSLFSNVFAPKANLRLSCCLQPGFMAKKKKLEDCEHTKNGLEKKRQATQHTCLTNPDYVSFLPVFSANLKLFQKFKYCMLSLVALELVHRTPKMVDMRQGCETE